MGFKRYYSSNGRITGQQLTSGGNRVDFMFDPLGSVSGTVTQTAAVQNTYVYNPYGTLLNKSGSGSDPDFTWVGSVGYRQTRRVRSDVYAITRHFSSTEASWGSVDWLWPEQRPYAYVGASPATKVDPFGLQLVDLAPVQIPESCPYIPERDETEPLDYTTTCPVTDPNGLTILGLVSFMDEIVDLCKQPRPKRRVRSPQAPRPHKKARIYTYWSNSRGRWVSVWWNERGCSQAELDALSEAVDELCKGERSSCRGLKMPQDADQIKHLRQRNLDCLTARTIRDWKCFYGGDEPHKIAQDIAYNQWQYCDQLLRGKS